MFEQEDVSRIMRQWEEERTTMRIEKKRTMVTMEEKYEIIKRMEPLLTELGNKINLVKSAEPPQILHRLSNQLIGSVENQQNSKEKIREREQLKSEGLEELDDGGDGSRYKNSDYHYLDKLIENLSIIPESVTNGNTVELKNYYITKIIVTNPTVAPLLESMERVENFPGKLLLFFWHIYYTYYLNNETDQTMSDILDSHASYIRGVHTELNRGEEIDLKALKLGETGSRAESLIEWELYRTTETINMNYFNEVLESAQNRDIISGLLLRWRPKKYDAKLWVIMVTYIYPVNGEDPVRPNFSLPPYSKNKTIVRLLRLSNPALSELEEDEVKEILLSHLLWVYFEENEYDQIISSMFPENSQKLKLANIVRNIISQTLDQLNSLKKIYLPLVVVYLNLITDYFRDVKSFLDSRRPLLVGGLPQIDVDNLESANEFYGKFKNLSELVVDDAFLRYIRDGVNLLISDPSKSISTPMVSTYVKEYLTESLPKEYLLFSPHILFRYYYVYQTNYRNYLIEEETRMKRAIDKAKNKIATMLGDEKIERNGGLVEVYPSYNQKRAFTTDPLNSGFIQIKSEIMTLIDNGLNNVYDYCPNLEGLPLEGFHSASARSTGLTVKFINYLSALYARNDSLHPDKYNAAHHHDIVVLSQFNTMNALKYYGFTKRGNTYNIYVERPNSKRGSAMISATLRLPPNATRDQRDNFYAGRTLGF